jgi:hypothetical protein
MKTHAEVHEEVARILHGTRLLTFMVTTNSFQGEDGAISVEWAATISSGREPVFYFRARDSEKLLAEVRAGVDRRRSFYSIRSATDPLSGLHGYPPGDTSGIPRAATDDRAHGES